LRISSDRSSRARRKHHGDVVGVRLVGTKDVDEAAKTADEVGLLRGLVRALVAYGDELGERGGGAAGEHEDRRPQRVEGAASRNLPSCIGARKWRSHPSSRPSSGVSNSSQNTSGRCCSSTHSPMVVQSLTTAPIPTTE
jgi:hypothetical protein